MRHLGDITKISGYDAPIVDCIIGGSPCQDLSVAGKRAGLDGERSGLFMEQIRIVKEMRERDERNGRTGVDVRCRYLIWENVPGALSSGKPKGEDFRIVLEEIAKVCDKDAVIPMPDKGKWTNHGCIMGDGWSVAWRVLDAQFWGVPQRRRRIALVADFGGQSAPEILFVSKGVSGNTDESKQKREATSSDASGGIGADDCERVYCIEPGAAKRLGGYVWEGLAPTLRTEVGDNRPSVAYTLKIRSGCEGGGKGALIQKDKSATLSTLQDQTLFQPVYSVENHPNDSRVGINEDGKVQALTSRMGTGGGNVPMVMQCYSKSRRAQSATDVVYALDRETYNCGQNFARSPGITEDGVNPTLVSRGPSAVCYSVDQGGGKSGVHIREGQAPTLTTTHDGAPAVCYMESKPNFIDVELEVAVRKYDVNKELLQECLRDHKGNFTNKEIAEALGKPLTLVEHWFRRDNSFAIPDPDIWVKLKELLGIETTEFDQSIMEFEVKSSNYDMRNRIHTGNVAPTLACGCGNNLYMVPEKRTHYIVRRLTPLECERLQGYPDGWTDIGEWVDSKGKKKQTSDAVRYKALGNSIALPPWKWVLKRLCACYERDATMASLFDGIGGFPYLWEQLNGKGTCLWASEIEEFPMAVTKVRIGE